MKKIGFIGLGIMGKPMAKNLLKAGYSLVVHDVNREAVKEVVAAGYAEEAFSSREVAQKTKYIITMLPNSPHVKEVILGKDGILEGATAGTIIMDMSSISPIVSRELYDVLNPKGIKLLDAPVSGGEPGAINATLSIMVGGDEDIFNECKDVFSVLGKSVVRVGEIGSGNITKLANQVIVAINIAAMSEALVLAAKAGVDPELLYNAIRGGLAGSSVLDQKALRVMQGNFEPGFKIDLHIKDLANAIDTSKEIGVPLFLTTQVMEMLKALKIEGKGQKDHSAILNFYEKLAGFEVRK